MAIDATGLRNRFGRCRASPLQPRILLVAALGLALSACEPASNDVDPPADSAAEALYPGRIDERPHKYVEAGKYLRIRDGAGGDGVLLFATNGNGNITGWRIGVPPQVDYVGRLKNQQSR